MKTIQLFVVLLVATASFAAGALWENRQGQAAPLESRIMREADAKKSTGDWGSI